MALTFRYNYFSSWHCSFYFFFSSRLYAQCGTQGGAWTHKAKIQSPTLNRRSHSGTQVILISICKQFTVYNKKGSLLKYILSLKSNLASSVRSAEEWKALRTQRAFLQSLLGVSEPHWLVLPHWAARVLSLRFLRVSWHLTHPVLPFSSFSHEQRPCVCYSSSVMTFREEIWWSWFGSSIHSR